MNIKNIKTRADELLVNCKGKLSQIILIVSLIGLVPSLISEVGFLGSFITLILTWFFLPVGHGQIVAMLKVARNNEQAVSQDDAWVGFKRFKELFPTYLVMNLVTEAVVFVGIMLIFMLVFGNAVALNVQSVIDVVLSSFGWVILIIIVLLVVVYILELCLFATPYLLEQYHIQMGRAMKESFAFMKGHKLDLFKLDISFIGWLFLQGLVIGVMDAFCASIPFVGAVGGSILAIVFGAYTFLPKYQLSKAIFFEEIAYQRYGGQTVQDEEVVQEDVVDETKGEDDANKEDF